jgi:hypothetical protein
MVEVHVGEQLAAAIASRFGPQRAGAGDPSEWDFWGGPLAAALIGFRDFESLRFTEDPRVRTLHVVDPVFGPVVFVGVLVEPGVVELAEFGDDPDYWDLIGDDPND